MDAQDIRSLKQAYMKIYEKDLDESLADMFKSAHDDLYKKAEGKSTEAQKKLKAIKKKLADAQQEIARQDAEREKRGLN